jgi:hypothetical protein
MHIENPLLFTRAGFFMKNDPSAPLGVQVSAPLGVQVSAPLGVQVSAPLGVQVSAPLGVQVSAPLGVHRRLRSGCKSRLRSGCIVGSARGAGKLCRSGITIAPEGRHGHRLVL